MDSDYEIVRYQDEFASIWDKFLEQTVNGTFLQSRRFLSYHPKDRFADCSLLIYDCKKNLVGLCPGAVQIESGQKVFVSHPGSTFGGLLVSAKNYRALKLIGMVEALETWLTAENVQAVDMRITPSLFSKEADDLLEYVLYYRGYQESNELSTYIDYSNYKVPIESNFSRGKRPKVHKGKKLGFYGKKLQSLEELKAFYEVLCGNLQKYQVKPVHKLEELQDFMQSRLREECEFFGIFLPQETEDSLVAGGMVFYFLPTKVAHTQYLASVTDYSQYSPMTFLYDYLIRTMQEKGFRKLSFGISTEDRGRYLNMGLIRSKESFGSKHCANRKFWKELN